MATRFDRLSDILSVRRGDIIRKSDRSELFTGPSVGNTPQKGINWLGTPPDYLQVIVRCEKRSGYSDRYLPESDELFLYYLMVKNRGKSSASINYDSKENRALLDQAEHGAPVLLMTDPGGNSTVLEIEGRFELVQTHHDNPVHPAPDSVILRKISD